MTSRSVCPWVLTVGSEVKTSIRRGDDMFQGPLPEGRLGHAARNIESAAEVLSIPMA